MEPKKFIDFIITQKCTYRCPYCSQSKCQTLNLHSADYATIKAFYKLLDNIDKDFEITITGGEAILHPEFYSIIKTVKEKDFKINLISNLSFSISKYIEIFDILNESLNQFDISLHLNQIRDFKLTLEKLEQFLQQKPKHTKTVLYIPLYLIDEKQEDKIEKILKIAKKYNVSHSFQKIRFLNSYSKEKAKKFSSNHKKEKTFSKLCHAGSKSAVIYENGDVYRCYSSRFSNSNFIGNIKDECFELKCEPIVCSQMFCTCPKPKNYNQITDDADNKAAIKNAFLNFAYLPYYFFKNKHIVLAKLKQKFNIK